MVAVAIMAVVMEWAVNVQNVLHEEGDFAYGILFIEGIGMLMLLALLLAIGYVIFLVRHDDAYAARLIPGIRKRPASSATQKVADPLPSRKWMALFAWLS